MKENNGNKRHKLLFSNSDIDAIRLSSKNKKRNDRQPINGYSIRFPITVDVFNLKIKVLV